MLQIGRNIFSLVFSRVISGVILFLVYTRLVQYLGPQAAGEFGLLASYLTVFGFFVDLGMSQLVIKRISEDKSHATKYLTNYFIIQLVLGLGFMILMDLFVLFASYPTELKKALYVTGFALLAASISLPFRAVLVAFQRLTIQAWFNFWNSMINAGMLASAVIWHKNIFYLAFIALAVGVFNIVVYAWAVHDKFAKFGFEFDKTFIKDLLVANTPFMLLTFFSIYNRIDGLILPHLRSFVETGYYAAAYKFWDTLAFIPGVIGISLYPFFADAMKQGQKDQVKKGLETYTRYMIAIGVPMTLGAFFLAKPLTLAFFGSDFLPTAQALWLLVAAVSVLFIYTPANSLIISELTKTATKITGFNLLFNLVANLIFIPIYGFVAAAVITVASECIQLIGYSYFIKKKIVQYSFLRNFIKPLIAGVAMSFFIYYFRNHGLIFLIIGGSAIYTILLLLLKFFHQEDWQLFKAAINIRQKLNENSL